MLPSVVNAQKQNSQNISAATLSGRRKLGGTLEVSSVGIGVQNMSRTYQTTIPTRPEMINIIRKAFDQGVTLFDAAEAYGPFEVERILGEALVPIRNKVVIETKFGWNIDQKTGQRLPGLKALRVASCAAARGRDPRVSSGCVSGSMDLPSGPFSINPFRCAASSLPIAKDGSPGAPPAWLTTLPGM